MASGEAQVIVENGRVSGLFKTVNAISVILISTLLIWVVLSLSTLNTQVAVLISQNETHVNEHTRIDNRIAELERQWRNSNSYNDRIK